MYEDLKEYKGIKVERRNFKPGNPKANGTYSKSKNTITLYNNFFKLDKVIQESILEHEYGHYIWHKMPMLYRKIWEWISNGKLIKTLNIMGITTHTENDYVTEYAKTKVTEDWSECIEAEYLLTHLHKGKRFGTFADVKVKIAKSMYDYFSNKELGN